jgi:serine protease Do
VLSSITREPTFSVSFPAPDCCAENLTNIVRAIKAKGLAAEGDRAAGLGLGLAPAATVAGAGSQGVVITEVDPNGLAAEKGLAAGDVILDVSGSRVTTLVDVYTAVSRARESGKHDVLMRVKTRDGSIRFVALSPLALRSGRPGVGSPD